jgi:hypothetical protein
MSNLQHHRSSKPEQPPQIRVSISLSGEFQRSFNLNSVRWVRRSGAAAVVVLLAFITTAYANFVHQNGALPTLGESLLRALLAGLHS